MAPIKISIVVPVYNSENCLLPLFKEIEKELLEFNDYEVLFINDKSSDSSWKKIEEICSLNDKVIGINLRKNFGQDNAILAGLRKACGEFVVIMDDDLQHPPSGIIPLYNACREGYDVCYASFPNKKQKFWKNLGSWINGKFSEKILNKPPAIYLSPFKIIRKSVVDEIGKFSGPFPYIDATVLTITSKLTQIEITHHLRYDGKSNYNFFRSILVFIKHITNYSIFPLRVISLIGFFSAFISFILGFVFLFEYFINDHRVEGWITIVIFIIFFGGMILLSLGLIGEYIGRIFLSVNSKPQYSIDMVIEKKQKTI